MIDGGFKGSTLDRHTVCQGPNCFSCWVFELCERNSSSWNGPPEVLQRLSASGWLKSIHWFDQVDSTNRAGKDLVQQPDQASPGLLVTRRQTAGNGRRGRSWYSDHGSLTFSLILSSRDVGVSPVRWPQLALVSGLAVCDVLSELVAPTPVGLKWPNDVYVAGRKVAGILIEVAGPRNDWVVVGIGVNIATDVQSAPDEVRRRAASIHDIIAHPLSALEPLPEIIQRFQLRLDQWRDDFETSLTDYAVRCVLTDCDVEVRCGGRLLQGRCMGVGRDGELRLMVANVEMAIQSGEVVSWKDPRHH